MTFDHAYLYAGGDARLVYNVSGGQVEHPMPAGKEAPSSAVSAEWDGAILTMTYTLEDGDTLPVTLTSEQIESAKETESL